MHDLPVSVTDYNTVVAWKLKATAIGWVIECAVGQDAVKLADQGGTERFMADLANA